MIKQKPATDAALTASDDPCEAIVERRKRRIARQALFDVLADAMRAEVARHQATLASLMLTSKSSGRSPDLVAALIDADPTSSALILVIMGRPQILSHSLAGVGPYRPNPAALQPVNRH